MIVKFFRLEFRPLIMWILPFSVVGWVVVSVMFILLGLVRQFTEASNGVQVVLCAIFSGVVGLGVGILQRDTVARWSTVTTPWVGSTAFGWALAGAAWWGEYKWFGGDHFSVTADTTLYALFLGALAGGLTTGMGQWLAVRQCCRRASLWLVITVGGWMLGIMMSAGAVAIVINILQNEGGVYLTLFALIIDLGFLVLGGIITGIVTGVGFYLLVKQKVVSQ